MARNGRSLLGALVLWLVVPAVLAVAAAGDLDPAFGENGKVTTNFSGKGDGAADLVVQADGKLVAAGDAGGRFALARYRPNGTLDPTFGGNGKVVTNFPGIREAAAGVAIQGDGKIVAAGGMSTANGGRFALARYEPDGTLDDSFGGDGKVVTNFTPGGDFASDVVIQSNGKIVAVGAENWFSRFALARYRKDGSLDPTFGGDGKVATNFTSAGDGAVAVALQANGRIVTAGWAKNSLKFALARYRTDGTRDPDFSGNGKVTTNFTPGEDAAYAVAIQDDGGIVAAGYIGEGSDEPRFALARYETNGTLDPTFGGDGRVSTNFVDDALDVARGVSIQSDGKIVAAGSAGEDSGNSKFGLARYEVDGSLDPTFGTDGRVTTNFAGGIDQFDLAEAVTIQANGKIVAAGQDGSFVGRFALARYLPA